MKISIEKAVVAFKSLIKSRLGKMKREDKSAIIKTMQALRHVAEYYDGFLKDATEKLEPDGYLTIREKIDKGVSLSEEEEAIAIGYNQDLSSIIREELNKEIEIEISSISSESLETLADINDLEVAEIMNLYDVLGS